MPKHTDRPEVVRKNSNHNQILKHKAAKREKAPDKVVTDFIVEGTVSRSLESQQIVDPFSDVYNMSGLGNYIPIAPPYNPNIIRQIPFENNILLQCIDTMVQNIAGTSHHLEFMGPDDDEKFKERPEVQAELKRTQGFLDAPNEDYDFVELQKRVIRDKETYGYAFYEIVRDKAGFILAVYHVPSDTIRLTPADSELVPVTYKLNRGGNPVKLERHRHFRRYIQMNLVTGNYLYFKEFGDPRSIDVRSGKPDDTLPTEHQANELLMFSDYKSGFLYGQPRWINQVPSILGSRESEVVNLNFFRANAIPAMVVQVSGGYLSQDSVDGLDEKFNGNKGQGKMHEVLILEAYGDEQGATVEGQMPIPKLEMKALAGERQNDALFQDYDKACQNKVRGAFRLPSVLFGGTDEYTYAAINSAMVAAESQVFMPERNKVDDFINKYFLGDGVNSPKFWRFRSNPTRLVDDEQIAKSLTVLNNIGAITPNDAINISNELFNLRIKPIKEPWADFPYSMVIKLIEKGLPIKGLENLVDADEKARLIQIEFDLANRGNDPAATKTTDTVAPAKKPKAQKKALEALGEMTAGLSEATKK